jgi:hypothetical protein
MTMNLRVIGGMFVALVAGCDADTDVEPAPCEAAPGTGDAHEFLDLRVHFENQTAVADDRIVVMTYETLMPDRVYGVASARVDGSGSFEVMWPDAYRRYEYQPIAFYIDLDEDGACTPGVDLGERHISSAWNPVGDEPLEEQLAVFPFEPVDVAVCEVIERCAL